MSGKKRGRKEVKTRTRIKHAVLTNFNVEIIFGVENLFEYGETRLFVN